MGKVKLVVAGRFYGNLGLDLGNTYPNTAADQVHIFMAALFANDSNATIMLHHRKCLGVV